MTKENSIIRLANKRAIVANPEYSSKIKAQAQAGIDDILKRYPDIEKKAKKEDSKEK